MKFLKYIVNENENNIKKHFNNKRLTCINCGLYGHNYKRCNQPIISYGIICFKFKKIEGEIHPYYLIVQRRDSLCYIEFVRGIYDIENKKYIDFLFSQMTEEERQNIKNNTLESLWDSLTLKRDTKKYIKEFQSSKEKFLKLKTGILMKTRENNVIEYSIESILRNVESIHNETEWEFPKGRRNINEDDVGVSLREFTEETNIESDEILLETPLKKYEEVFTGSNKKRYKHVYFLAKLKEEDINVKERYSNNSGQLREIRDVEWSSYEELMVKFRDYKIEKKELITRIHNSIKKYINYYKINGI